MKAIRYAVPLVALLLAPFLADNAEAAKKDEKLVVLVIGKPGSGKTTQARNISRKYKIPIYSMAKILEKEAGWVSTPLKKGMKAQRLSGDLVDDRTANRLITKYITRKKARKGFLLDGYPVTVGQAVYLGEQLQELGLPKPVVIHIDVPDEVAIERMTRRKRADDTPENIQRRIADYRNEEQKAKGLFPEADIKRVDGTGSPNEVWKLIQAAIQQAGS